MFGCPLPLRTGHSVASRTALFLTAAVLFLTLPQAADAQPESARKVAKSLQLQEARTLYTRGSEKVSEVSASTWLIERNRMSRDDGGCKENRWVEVEYTEGLAQTVVTEGDLQVLYFCDSDLEGDPQEHIARPFYNFRALLGGTATIAEDGSALFREVKDRHRPLLKSLRRDLQSGRVRPEVQVTVAGNTFVPDTFAVAEGGIRIPVGTELEQAAEERRAIFEWSGKRVANPGTDYVRIPGQSQASVSEDSKSENASPEGTFPWWALAFVGILTTIAGALGLFLYWERREKRALRTKIEMLQEILRSALKKKEKSPQKAKKDELQSLHEEILETVDQRVDPQDIEELSRRIGKALFSHLEEKAASGEEPTEDKHLRLPVDELEARVPSSPLLSKLGKEEASGTGDRDQQNDSQGLVATSLRRSIDVKRMERLSRPKKVNPDFMSVHNKCRELAIKYFANNPKKHSLVKRILKLLRHRKENYTKGIREEQNAAKKLAKIFMIAWDPGHPEKSLEVLGKATRETEGEWDFYYSPGGSADSLEEIRRRPISELAIDKIKKEMEQEIIPNGEVRTITPGIDWQERREGQEFSYSPIQYRADYSSFSTSQKKE